MTTNALYTALWTIANANHPDYPGFRSGTEAEFAEHLISVAQAAIDAADAARPSADAPAGQPLEGASQ